MFGAKANGDGKKGNYRQVSLDEFSDDDSDHDDLTPPSRSSSKNNSMHNGSIVSGNGSSNDFVGNSSLGRQQELMRKQDEGLEMLSQSAERLGAMSLQIGEEIGFQNKMLDEMESDLERADQDLDLVTRQTKKFIEQAGGTKNCIIITVLSVVVLVLLLLLIYL